MNIISKLFKKTQHEKIQDENHIYIYEQALIERVIELLRTHPDDFSANWFNKETIDSSVRYKNTSIIIMISDGQIIKPIDPPMSKEQKKLVKQLVKPIVERDIKYVIKNLLSNTV